MARRSDHALSFAVALAVVVSIAACDRTEEPAAVEPTLRDSPPPAHNAPTLTEVRDAHGFALDGEGAVCTDDRDCVSPLRCLDATCFWPAALTGDVDAAPVRVTFDAERGPTTYALELADDSWERTRGLMHRHSMVEDMGMVFDFGVDAPRRFWMRNTYTSLDMVFVTADGRVDSVAENAVPETDTAVPSAGPARYVVELNAGEVARMGLRAGAAVTFEGLPTDTE